ncbi:MULTISPECIES: stage II sporulation protein D [Heyndrickxia]|uniref:Sporulation stage II protein D amidase enhancer LytB N-terminal domain-containing protein n=1 Tax=Heyndrickxia sporothermodurans TaxID=46224 RepID=A0A150L3Y7_9BACI|nr:stage II sporulation protein D [Heyndrickxia sporothermodurans]KYD07041.1 hypothetical protein B4102_1986 [Heyndrickxia sporothermodurans]
MKHIKPIVLVSILILAVSFAIPSLLVLPFSKEKASGKLDENMKEKNTSTLQSSIDIAVFRNTSQKVEQVPLEEYVVGVVASEMHATFEEEALKAQALAARTYIVRQLLSGNKGIPKGANVTDTVSDQVFQNKKELKKHWGSKYQKNINKITKAVKATEGKILTYDGKPIFASFFSTSNGYTENSQDYWANAIPYLKSVESPWDKKSPKYQYQQEFVVNDVEKKLGVTLRDNKEVSTNFTLTEGKRIGTVIIGGKKFTGREVREKLGLRSSDFSLARKGNKIIVTTRGYGHGVGMSQYGANGMARSGKSYKEIVQHYYQGIEISESKQLLDKVTAKK